MKATITVIRRVRYSRTIELTKEGFERLDSMLYDEDTKQRKAATAEINEFIDPLSDWQDDDVEDADIDEEPE